MPTNSPIREEFEKSFLENKDKIYEWSQYQTALWAAGWMAERCIEIAKDEDGAYEVAERISQIAKELKEHEGE